MTGLNTRYVQPKYVTPIKTNHIGDITLGLVDHTEKARELKSHRTMILEKIRDLSHDAIRIDQELARISEQASMLDTLNSKPPVDPEPEPTQEEIEKMGGRPLGDVFSTQKWYDMLSSNPSAIGMVAHYYSRPESGIARLKRRAEGGELPQSSIGDLMFSMLLNGEDPVVVAERIKKPVSWVKNYNNMITAFSRIRNEGKPIPERYERLLASA